MFTPEYRNALRSALLEFAANDPRVSGAAITGSAAEDREDEWSDIDLAFGVRGAAELPSVLGAFTKSMYDRHSAVHHYDIAFGAWTYRVFFLPGTLQVDLAFAPASDFRPMAQTFRLVFGEAQEAAQFPDAAPRDVIAFAWLYALHARSSIHRGKLWQAEHMISALRDHVMTLACLRHGLPAAHGKGMDLLPHELRERLSGALIGRLDAEELRSALNVAVRELVDEIQVANPELGTRIRSEMLQIVAASP